MDQAIRRLTLAAAVAAMWMHPELNRSAAAVELAASIEAARSAGAGERPVVLVFSAPWCGWCRKFQATTLADPLVAELEQQFLWVKIDADENPDLAARWQVRGLPHTVVIDVQDRLLGTQPGYQSAEAFVRFLRRSLEQQPIAPAGEQVRQLLERLAEAEDRRSVIGEVIEHLARSPAVERSAIQTHLLVAGPDVPQLLVEFLQDERLGVRAAAWGTLQRLELAGLAFDPFATAETRGEQAASIRARLTGTSAAPPGTGR